MMFRYFLFGGIVMALIAAGYLISMYRSGRVGRWAATAAITAGCGWLLVNGADLTYQMVFDARYPASVWLSGELKPGERIGFYGSPDQLPHFPPGIELHRAPLVGHDTWLEMFQPDVVIVAADFSSRSNGAWSPFNEAGTEHSFFLSEKVFRGLMDGSQGYSLIAQFKTRPLTGRPIRFLPWINPPVKVFRRNVSQTSQLWEINITECDLKS
jgi:hypothetical protein